MGYRGVCCLQPMPFCANEGLFTLHFGFWQAQPKVRRYLQGGETQETAISARLPIHQDL